MAIKEMYVALASIFFIGLLLALSYCWRWRRYIELGMKLPGPPALPVTGNCLHFKNKNLLKNFPELLESTNSYGSVTRLWFGPILVVVLTDPDSFQKVAKHDKSLARGYIARKSLGAVFQNGLFSLDTEKWRIHRKIVSSALHIRILESFVDIFAKNSDILANKLKDLADGITAHNVVRYFNRCTLDVIYQTSSGIQINAQNGNDDCILNALKTMHDISMVRLITPWLLIDWIFNASKLGMKYFKDMKPLTDLIINELETKKKNRETAGMESLKDEKPSIIDLLIQTGDINEEDIVAEIATIVAAGTETTSRASCYVLALLGENQHVQAKVMQEQQDVFGDDIIRPVRSEDLPKMVYLEQVLKEAMRLFPPVPLHFRETTKEIDLGNGQVVPEGAIIIMPVFATHRNPKYFPDPEKFDPDRFSPQNSEGRHPYAYTPFGFGRRMCVGHMFATMEAKTILSTVLRRYCITEIEGGIKGLEQNLKVGVSLSPTNGIRLKFIPRQHATH